MDITIETAISHIRQLSQKKPFPFVSVVGAGMSSPSVPLASEIERRCKVFAKKHHREAHPESQAGIDTYSAWFNAAYPSPVEKRQYLEKLIVNKPLSSASMLLAHILQAGRLSRLVITPNFDDFIERSILLFGGHPLVCDHPDTINRVELASRQIQILHVHGSFQFYDCCNLKDEILARAGDANSGLSNVGQIVLSSFAENAILVIGYSGWESDVIMTALRKHLERRPGSNVYWFCHSGASKDVLPNWLKQSPRVYFVLPHSILSIFADEMRQTYTAAKTADVSSAIPGSFALLPKERSTEGSKQIQSARIYGATDRLAAKSVLSLVIREFGLESPRVITDPLGHLAELFRNSFPIQQDSDKEDIYRLREVVDRVQRAIVWETEQKIAAETQKLSLVRTFLRSSQFSDAIKSAVATTGQPLHGAMKDELVSLLSEAVEGTFDPAMLLAGSDRLVELVGMNPTRSEDATVLANALLNKGHALVALDRAQEAVDTYRQLIKRFGGDRRVATRRIIAEAHVNLGSMLGELERPSQAITAYDRFLRASRRWSDPFILTARAKALFNKALTLTRQQRHREALAAYTRLCQTFRETTVAEIAAVVSSAFLNKGHTHGLLGEGAAEIASYDALVNTFSGFDDRAVRIAVAKGLFNKSITLQSRGDWTRALATINAFIQRSGSDPDLGMRRLTAQILLVKGMTLASTGDRRALNSLKWVERKFRDNDTELRKAAVMAKIARANLYRPSRMGLQPYDEVIDAYSRSTDSDVLEQVALARINKAIKLGRLGQWTEAASTLPNRIIDQMSDEPYLYVQTSAREARGVSLIGARRYKEAVETLELALSRNPNLTHIFGARLAINIGVARAKSGRRGTKSEVIKDFEHAIRLLARDRHPDARALVALARRYKAGALDDQPEEQARVQRRIWSIYQFSKLREEKVAADTALNGLAYYKLLQSKKEHQRGRHRSSRRILKEADKQINDLLARQPDTSIKAVALGNRAYISFLLDDRFEARQTMREAFTLGGSKLMKEEIKDSRKHTLPVDKEFRKLIRKVETEGSSAESVLRHGRVRLAARALARR